MDLLQEIGPELSGLERLEALLANDRHPGLGETLDIRLIEVAEGRVVLEAAPDTHLYNPFGVVHGGFTAAMLDSACGYAVMSKLAAGQRCTTLEIKVAYHRAMSKDTGLIRAEGKIVNAGRRAAFSEARLTDLDGKLYASATSSLMILSASD